MKIAVCFFGITRNLKEHTLDSIEQCLLSPVAEKDPAYKKFGHFNIVSRISNPRTREREVSVNPMEFELLKCDAIAQTDQQLVDEQLNFDEIKKFGDGWNDNYFSLKNLLRQFYSLNEVTKLLLAAGQSFDLVIYSRADIRFQKPVKIPLIRANTLYTPWFDQYRGLNDRFALGDFATMIKYGQRCSMAQQYCNETGKPLHAESFLLWYANKQGLRNTDLTSIEFCRVRANGVVSPVKTSISAKLKYRVKKALRPFRKPPWK